MEKINAMKSLGQNFLKDESVLVKIANSFSTKENDLIVEIGPGKGALTKFLVKKNSFLICYEVDMRMKNLLLNYQSEKCQIIFDDFLKRNLKDDISDNYEHIYFIANIPYYITTPIITHILESNIAVSGMTLLVQKEVADRFCAYPGSRSYGYFTVLLQHFFDIKKLFDVHPTCFFPEPKVMSSVVCFVKKKCVQKLNLDLFRSFLKDAFSQKRKTLKNNLKEYDWNCIFSVLEKYHYNESVRSEELSYDIFVEIFNSLYS